MVAHAFVAVDDAGEAADEVDDFLGFEIAGRGLAGEEIHARHGRDIAVLGQAQVVVDDVHDVEELALVFVDALGLDVEDGVRGEDDARGPGDETGQVFLVGAFDGHEFLAERGVFGQGDEFLEPVEVLDPGVADGLGDERGQARVGLVQPAARGDPVGFVVELARPQGGVIREEHFLDQFGVQPRDAVDGMGADHGEVGHAHLFAVSFIDQRQAAQGGVAGVACRADVVEETPVDFVDELKVARQDLAQQFHGPHFQGFGHERVVGEGQGARGDVPGPVPGHAAFVHEDAHEFDHGQGRVGVVELDGREFGQFLDVAILFEEAPGDVAQRAEDEKVFLDQAQFAAEGDGFARVEDLGHQFRIDLLVDGLDVVALVEDLHIEVVGGAGCEKTQVIDCLVAVADDGDVVGHAEQVLPVHPQGEVTAVRTLVVFDAAVDGHDDGLVAAFDLQGHAFGHPVVGPFDLAVVLDGLLEQAVFVVDAVAAAGQVKGGQGVEEAGGQASEAAVAERRVAFELPDFLQFEAPLPQQFDARVLDAHVVDVVPQATPQQIFDGEIIHALGPGVAVALPGFEHPVHEAVAQGPGQGHGHVTVAGLGAGLAQGVRDVVADGTGKGVGVEGFERTVRNGHGGTSSRAIGARVCCLIAKGRRRCPTGWPKGAFSCGR
ncbi:hypothetical protein DSECCO2_530350 [anaerobic digester metagenome]